MIKHENREKKMKQYDGGPRECPFKVEAAK